jgi:hypothetical protein
MISTQKLHLSKKYYLCIFNLFYGSKFITFILIEQILEGKFYERQLKSQ